MSLEKLPPGIIIEYALALDMPSLIKFCQTSKKINKLVCDNPQFWHNKLVHDYDLHVPQRFEFGPKEYYKFVKNVLKENPLGALDLAAVNGSVKLAKMAIDRGAKINVPRMYGADFNPITRASENGHLEMVKYLVKNGADVNVFHGEALTLAASNGHYDVVKYLVQNGADIHASDDIALQNAAYKGHLDVVKYLVENGANVHAGNGGALRGAKMMNHTDVIKYLMEHTEN